MTTAPIDVLAVMDASAEKITFLAQKTGVYHPATDLIEARAAVAELIEAAVEVLGFSIGDDTTAGTTAAKRLAAALERVS